MKIALFIDACGWTIIHFVWQGTALGLVLFVALNCLPRAQVHLRYATACAALAIMVTAVVVTYAWEISQPNVDSTNLRTAASNAVNPEAMSAKTISDIASVTNASPESVLSPEISATRNMSYTSEAFVAWTKGLSASLAPWIDRLVALWAVGVVVLTSRLTVDWWGIRILRQSGKVIDELRWLDSLSRLSDLLAVKSNVALLHSTRVRIPMAFGWLRPVVLIPTQMITGLTPNELQAILAHELAHIRRNDYAVNLLQNLAETLLFFHPAVWWASSQIRRERECCCDAMASTVCNGPLSYAEALFAVEMIRSKMPLAVAASDGSLLDRIRRLTMPRSSPRQTSGALLTALVAAMFVLLLIVGPQQASAVNDLRINTADQPIESNDGVNRSKSDAEGEEPSKKNVGDAEQTKDDDSNILQKIKSLSAPHLLELEQRGYKLVEGEDLKRIAPPFLAARHGWYHAANPTQHDLIPAGPDAILFHWNRDGLTSWGMCFGRKSLESLMEWTAGIYPQNIEGLSELREHEIPGDWIVRPDASPENIVAELEKILNRDLKLNVRMRFANVERDVFVVKGDYAFQPLPGFRAEEVLYYIDRTARTDSIQVFGEKPEPSSGAGGGTGDFNLFCKWLGRWIDKPIVVEASTLPKRELSWRLHEPSPATRAERALAHDSTLVLAHVSQQIGLKFVQEKRSIRILSIEQAN